VLVLTKIVLGTLFHLIFWIVVTSSAAVASPSPVGEYAVGLEQLVSMTKNQNISALQQYGGASLLQHIFVCDLVLLK